MAYNRGVLNNDVTRSADDDDDDDDGVVFSPKALNSENNLGASKRSLHRDS
jgi:hypothetical protein